MPDQVELNKRLATLINLLEGMLAELDKENLHPYQIAQKKIYQRQLQKLKGLREKWRLEAVGETKNG